jgi:hypothetical protein
MRPAPVLFGLTVLLGSLAVRADSSTAAPVACTPAPTLCADQVPLSQAGAWTVSPRLSRRLVEVSPGVFVAVKGMHERRHVRVARWIESLQGDPRAVFTREGMPVYRYRELAENHLYEYWTYPARSLTYVFEGDRLVGTEPF